MASHNGNGMREIQTRPDAADWAEGHGWNVNRGKSIKMKSPEGDYSLSMSPAHGAMHPAEKRHVLGVFARWLIEHPVAAVVALLILAFLLITAVPGLDWTDALVRVFLGLA